MPATNTHSIYGGRALVHFHERGHRYEIEIPKMGLSMSHPSMTTIIKALGKLDDGALQDWVGRKAAEYVLDNPPRVLALKAARERYIKTAGAAYRISRDRSGDIGTIVHGVIENLLRDGVDEDLFDSDHLDDDAIVQAFAAIEKAKRFLTKNRILPRGIERAFWSPSLGVVGTADLPAKINGRLSINDWKISKYIGVNYRVQLTGYAVLFEEEFPGEQVLDRRVVAFGAKGEDPKVECWTREGFDADAECFRRLVDVWRWLVVRDPFYRGRTDYDPPMTAKQVGEFWQIPAEEKAA